MKKLIALVLTTLFLGMGVANAIEVANATSVAKVGSLSESDMAFLFGENATSVSVIALSQEEMEATKGEGFFTSLIASIGFSASWATFKWIGCKAFTTSKCNWEMNVGSRF